MDYSITRTAAHPAASLMLRYEKALSNRKGEMHLPKLCGFMSFLYRYICQCSCKLYIYPGLQIRVQHWGMYPPRDLQPCILQHETCLVLALGYQIYTRRKKAVHLSTKTKMFDFEVRVLIGWIARVSAIQPIRTQQTINLYFWTFVR